MMMGLGQVLWCRGFPAFFKRPHILPFFCHLVTFRWYDSFPALHKASFLSNYFPHQWLLKLNSFSFRRGWGLLIQTSANTLLRNKILCSPAITVHLSCRLTTTSHHFISNLDTSISLLKSFGQMHLIKGVNWCTQYSEFQN